MGQHIFVFVFLFLHIFQNFPCTLGEKRIFLVFTGVYVCVKAKLTFVSFFPFFCTFPLHSIFILILLHLKKIPLLKIWMIENIADDIFNKMQWFIGCLVFKIFEKNCSFWLYLSRVISGDPPFKMAKTDINDKAVSLNTVEFCFCFSAETSVASLQSKPIHVCICHQLLHLSNNYICHW